MEETLFGDLEQSSVNGISSKISPCFISNHVVAFCSGNSINFRDIEHLKQNESYPSIITDSQITALATFPQEGVIAYAEKHSCTIKLIKWPQLIPFGVNNGELQAPSDLSIVSLTFSGDGQYLASLGSLPEHSICVWDWRGNIQRPRGENSPLLSSVSNGGPASLISFNLLDKRMLCTSNPTSENGDAFPEDEFDLDVEVGEREDGLCRGIRFWRLFMGNRKWDLTQMYVRSVNT
jgi:WD40 repeat protein